MKTNSNYDVIFVYSEIQYEEEEEIAKKVGKKFRPGKLYSGLSFKEFTKMIRSEQYDGMRSQYPDVKIIAQGAKSTFKYTDPKKEFA